MRVLLPLLLLACDPPSPCQDDEVRRDGTCERYAPDDPFPALDVWRPDPGVTWQWQLTEAIDTTLQVEAFDIDLFDATDADLQQLSDRVVICYFSAGSHEAWRDDADDFPADAVGRPLRGWRNERWLDVTRSAVRDVLAARLDLAAARGCDAVEPDNVTAAWNVTGFGITPLEQLDFNRWLADAAHERGLSVGLKNDLEQLDDLADWFDWALNEECMDYDECEAYDGWLGRGLAVLHTEYVDDWSTAEEAAETICAQRPAGFSTLVKEWDLGPRVFACP